jgi:hypothetical protein
MKNGGITSIAVVSFVLAAVSSVCLAAVDNGIFEHRQLGLLEERHFFPPIDKTADATYPKSKSSSLMLSPCRPETNGYFGATSGAPLVVQYGFELETKANGNVDNALGSIGDHVMDTILSTAFPEICGFSRRLNNNNETPKVPKLTGFQFNNEVIDTSCK